ncbi:MAG: response regulator [Nitrospinae bacterium]|nr:response regulator [Nitrospinota bacterium]
MKVLIVEDDPASRSYLKRTLESQDHQTRIAEDGLAGLQIFKKWAPDLVFSDIKMPKMDGLELLEEIRKLNTDTIIVMITAFGCEEFAMRALQSRANNLLKKPVRHAELLPLIKKYAAIVESIDITQKEFGAIIKPELNKLIDNHMNMVPRIVARMVLETGKAFDKEKRLDIRLGLVEILTNAIEHGNLGITFEEKAQALEENELELLYTRRLKDPKFVGRRVAIEFKPDKDGCEWVVTDGGDGFNWQKAIERAKTGDILELHSRGVVIIQHHFDEVEYLGSGNKIRVRKFR